MLFHFSRFSSLQALAKELPFSRKGIKNTVVDGGIDYFFIRPSLRHAFLMLFVVHFQTFGLGVDLFSSGCTFQILNLP